MKNLPKIASTGTELSKAVYVNKIFLFILSFQAIDTAFVIGIFFKQFLVRWDM